MKRVDKFKKLKDAKLLEFMERNGKVLTPNAVPNEKIKLCSIDNFNTVGNSIYEKYKSKKPPILIGQVGGFYVLASLAGIANSVSKTKERPTLLFFDRKESNINNAIFNTLLTEICDCKERYVATLLGLSDCDIVKALKPSLYVTYIASVLNKNEELVGLSKEEKKIRLKALYSKDEENIDAIIAETLLSKESVELILRSNYDLNKIMKFAHQRDYDKSKHLTLLLKASKGKLEKEYLELFKKLSTYMTEYLSTRDVYDDFLSYLHEDIKTNSRVHMLNVDSIYDGYRGMINKNGSGSVKFISGIDISTKEGVSELEKILHSENFIADNNGSNMFQIDFAFLPHANALTEAYDLIKNNVQKYIMLNKDKENRNNHFISISTATLHTKTFKSIGAEFIEEERKSYQPFKNLAPIQEEKGLPKISFIAGSHYGNIYHSEKDTQNMIDMAIADHVDTVYIQGLIYATYYHHQTSRRLLTDPEYETLDLRLKKARALIKKLNDNGIKVVYQMGDEEIHLYQDLFKIYVREQGVKGNDFLNREDLRSKYDWIRPIIINELIPYLIRSGEDTTNFCTDEVADTRVSKICHVLKLYKEGLPLGDLAKYIKPEFLKDTDMFKVVHNTIDQFDEKNSSVAVNLLSNPNFSHITQYGKPNVGAIKNLRIYQSGSVKKYAEEGIPMLFVDSRQGMMSLAYQGNQATLNVPQMIDDSTYILHPELLPGIKEHILEDPTHKRVTQLQTRPNYPGGWEITGDIKSKMSIMPYYRRVREVMEHVQNTGEGLQQHAVGYINDWQTGSPTERLYYDIKAMDYMMYEAKVSGIFENGDLQQGHNYKKFPNESRHLGTSSVTQQMVSNVKLLRPFMRDAFGVINNGFEPDLENPETSKDISTKILNHLANIGLIENNAGYYRNMSRIKRGINFSTVDLKLTRDLKPYEKIIRKKLSSLINLEFIDLVEGNHEKNTDWDNKGFNEIEILRQELETIKEISGGDTDITLTEFMVNANGDFVNASYGFRTINGYNIINGHAFKPAGKGGGVSPTIAMSKYLDQLGEFSYRIDRANGAHYHIFEMSVIDNKLLTITGGGAGQSGYEQDLGYASQPCYVIDYYKEDGRILVETVGTEFLDSYQIQNPYIKEIGIDAFIEECTKEEATIYDIDAPKTIQKIYQRKLVPRKPNKIIGPRID